MAKFILPNSNGNFTKQSYLGTLEFMKLFYIGERYVAMLGVRLYSLSFLTGVSTVLGLALHAVSDYKKRSYKKR